MSEEEKQICTSCGYPAHAGHASDCKVESEKAKVPPEVDAKIKEIFDFDKYVILGHGSAGDVEGVMVEGLKTNSIHPDLTTVPFYKDTGVKGIYNKLMNWPYKGLKKVLIIMLPKTQDMRTDPRILWERALKQRDRRSHYESGTVLPAKYIKGYFDTETQNFVLNDSFAPDDLSDKESIFSSEAPNVVVNSEPVAQPSEPDVKTPKDYEPW